MSPIYAPGKVTLAKTSGASWIITPTYTPPYPSSPADAEEWTDLNTGITWVYSASTQEWTQQP